MTVALDVEGNIVEAGDVVYTSESVRAGSRAKRLVRCRVEEVLSENKLRIKILESSRTLNKLGSSVVRPLG